MALKYLRTANIRNKTVLVRVNVDVPIDDTGKVADDFRLLSLLPTIEYLIKQNCKIILFGHLGRPEGKWQKKYSLESVAKHLANLLERKFAVAEREIPKTNILNLVFFKGDITTEQARQAVKESSPQHIVLLENIRFYKEEEENDTFFAKKLAELADVYVNEAFAVDHRKAASVVAVTKYLPSYVGLELEQEIKSLNRVMERPKKPFVLMMAGIKISDKAKTLKNLGKHADYILAGGGIANVFFLASGYELGHSKVEAEGKKLAWEMQQNFKGKLILPEDVVVANKQMEKHSIRVCAPHEVRKSELILDIGPKTILRFARFLKGAKTIVWNGPVGNFEHKPFHTGTMALARIVGSVGKRECFTVVGGGETVDAVRAARQAEYIDHLSTGGGSMLEYLAGDTLPGIAALNK